MSHPCWGLWERNRMYTTDAAYAMARDTAEQVAAREAERAMAWAEHVADALRLVEEDDDE